jgi:SAM-dependent methyltransferase
MPEDIVQKHGDIYMETAPAVLGDLHSCLLDSIEAHKSEKERSKDVLVIGPSRWVLPYSLNPERTAKIIGDGKLVLMDYTDVMIEGAREFMKLIRFQERTNLTVREQEEKYLDLGDADAGSIILVKNNIRNPLPFPGKSFDCIDATLCIHHAIPYTEHLDTVARELYNALKPGGLLHYGTGDINMDSESRIAYIVNLVQSYIKSRVMVVDHREAKNGYVTKAYVTENHMELANEHPLEENVITIKEDGAVIIEKTNERLVSALRRERYKPILTGAGKVSISLIDPDKDNDFIMGVHTYYDAIYTRAATNECNTEQLEELRAALDFEKSNAERGVVEYYKGFTTIKRALERAGFQHIRRKDHKMGPFYNILAVKPR